MTWWLHRVGEIFVRVIIPASILVVGLLLLWYGVSLQLRTADAAAGGITLIGSILVIGSVVLLVLANTRRARDRWASFVIPEDEDERDNDNGPGNLDRDR